MNPKVKPIPDGRAHATPYLCCKGAARAIEFYKKAFGAVEVSRIGMPDGRVGHAEIKIGAADIMLADEFPEMGVLSPQTLGGSPVFIHLYFEVVDAVARQAVAAGAKLLRKLEDQFYGDRSGKLEDPFGHVWGIATHIEDVSHEEMQLRSAALYGGPKRNGSAVKEENKMPVKPIPDGFHSITPYMVVRGARELIDFLKRAFDATEVRRSERPDGAIMHAQLRIGDSPLMLGEGGEQWKPMPCSIYLYVKDTDAVYNRAIAAGGKSLMAPANQFYGDRNAGVTDPSGNQWWIATHIEDVSEEEMKIRTAAALKARQQGA